MSVTKLSLLRPNSCDHRKLYNTCGFRVRTLLLDGKFDHLRGKFPTLTVNVTAVNENVPQAERQIQVIKERFRSTSAASGFRKVPIVVTVARVLNTAFWLNGFPVGAGVSSTISPNSIVQGVVMDFKKLCRIPIEAYAQVHGAGTLACRRQGGQLRRPLSWVCDN